MRIFHTLVIGKGLLGSAAAKYLTEYQPDVALIGPDEPDDPALARVFASHYDAARVQRQIGKDAVWTRLCAESVAQYPTLAARAGVDFHGPAGCLYVHPDGSDYYLVQAPSLSREFGLAYRPYTDAQALAHDFPAFRFPAASQGLYEPGPAGWINPRALIRAQLAVFEQHGGSIFRETVVSVRADAQGFAVETAEGNRYHAEKILLAAGAFVNYFTLIPRPLALHPKSEVVLLARTSPEVTEQISSLPSLLYECDTPEMEGIYLIQPVPYPDGHAYLKMGCNLPEDLFFNDLTHIQQWFRSGDSDRFLPRLKAALHALLPGVPFEGYQTKRCIISRSAHGRPYIGETDQPGLFVASGCNGYSAMCSDAIGRVAAQVMRTGNLPEGYAEGDFALIYR